MTDNPDVGALIERLHEHAEVQDELSHDCDCPPEATANFGYAKDLREAASALLSLHAEVARLTQEQQEERAAVFHLMTNTSMLELGKEEGGPMAVMNNIIAGITTLFKDRDRLRERLTNEEETCRQLGRKFREEESERKSAEQRAEQAERELEDARKDAERYRWLRDCSAEHSDPPSSATLQAGLGIKVIFQSQGVCERSKLSVSLHGIALDAAIDAARGAK